MELCGTDPVVAERVEHPMPELPFGHGPGDFQIHTAAAVGLRQRGSAGFTRCPGLACGQAAGPLMCRAPARLAEHLVDPLAAAGVQAAGGGRGGQAVRVPVKGQLLLQRAGQRLHGTSGGLLPLHAARVRGGAGVATKGPVNVQSVCRTHRERNAGRTFNRFAEVSALIERSQ